MRRHLQLIAGGLLVVSLLSTCFALRPNHGTTIKEAEQNGTVARRRPPFDAHHVDFSDLLDPSVLPDYWNTVDPALLSRIQTNGEIPEQLVKVTDRRHRFPVFATACSLAFLLTIVAIIVVCTQ